MRDFTKLALVVVGAVLVAAAAACGDPATIVSGSVKDKGGDPVAEVSIVLESQIAGGYRKESEQQSDIEGRFNFVSVTGAAKLVRMTFSKDGFATKTVELPANRESHLEIVLEPE